MILTHDGPRWIVVNENGELLHVTFFDWLPGLPGSSSLRSVPVAWQIVPPFVELLGLDGNGAVYGARFHGDRGAIELVSAQVATTEGAIFPPRGLGPIRSLPWPVTGSIGLTARPTVFRSRQS